jgi:hypothetical protein
VLNYAIAMFRLILLITLIMIYSPRAVALSQEQPTMTPTSTPSGNPLVETPTVTQLVVIESPISGQALQGNVAILGSLPAIDFRSAELLFSYADNPTGTWFLVQSISGIPEGTPLAQWDTTTISDGTYTLRLLIRLADGSEISQSVTGLRVRNYTPIETETPTPQTPTLAPLLVGTPTATLTPTPLPPTATPFPQNPAQFSPQQYIEGFGKGVLAVFGFFALMGLYWIIRGRRR